MPRLAWLAFAGNPLTASLEARALSEAPVKRIPWPALRLHDKLGEGASGLIYRGEQRTAPDVSREVAVKLFKGEMTSDGLPHCEMAACIHAGEHPNLIPVHGKVADHPEDAHGLVMALIDSRHGGLAGPPSLESCTRDVYAPEKRFSPQAALRIAHGMASSARHLHERGILHGDLVARAPWSGSKSGPLAACWKS